ncbi:HlyD family efflux transporter periplasmic adaptor subunit [Streptomyces bathyalis]|uniref:HlyD family efflux transporter periplasmic adaptor subunit n=1 Tax=Streptomyces bathyalis TaxID=2710756 RepID=A0A7T1T8B8_9ACTN|nr:HlyD family efflux transporter periplasmic adaptor subunit [Streptomyces bathyalis]QPP08267.1 HlyD family efflux transporter periplasmic adaptor subunit [Streptomyces bathyalis]
MQFRQKAFSKLQSPEELDLPVRYARPQGWLVLLVTVLVMAGAGYWAVTGKVSGKLDAPGVLTHAKGSYVLQSPVAGQVVQVLAEEGRMLPANTPVLKVQTDRGYRAVRTVSAGRMTSLTAKIGSVIAPGKDVATVERVERADEPLVAMLYVPGSSGSTVSPGAAVDLTVQSAPTDEYGVLRGRVKAVGRAAQTRQQVTSFLGNPQLGAQFTKDGQPIAIMVTLDKSATTKSGYRWSSEKGPPYKIDSMTIAEGAIHQPSERPIDWLLP